VAENCHRGKAPWKHGGWAHEFCRNSDLKHVSNFNDLSETLKKKYGNKFSTCHWVDVDSGGTRIYSAANGAGYVFCDGTGGVDLISLSNSARGNDYREVIMTYPIFKTDNDTLVDFKNGVWENGIYNGRSLKFINFAALNYHSIFCGATSAIKNFHNPDNPESPLYQYLMKCAEQGGGEIDESKVDVKSWDFKTNRFQKDDELVVIGERKWGWDVKTLMKYFYVRYFWYG